MDGPLIFISTVTTEHETTRQRIANILTRLGYQAVWEEIFGTEAGDLRQMLRDKINSCDGLIHVAGEAYGAELPEVDADFGRVSYTQFEFLYARKQGKKTWLIFPGPGCTRDTPAEQLDWPRDCTHPDPAGFQIERRQLQKAYRDSLRHSGHLWHEPVNNTDLELKVERLRNEFADLRQGFQRWQNRMLAGVALSLVLLGCVLGFLWRMKNAQQKGLQQIVQGQKVTTARIRVHLIEASEARLKEDLAQAEKPAQWEKREELRDAAQRAHAARLARVEELAATFAQVESSEEATTVFKEMTRVLSNEGVDAALAYLDRHRNEVLQRIRKRASEMRKQNRADLLPLLKGADLQAAKGETENARRSYQEVLDIEPDWPEAMRDFGWFLLNESIRSHLHRGLNAAMADGQQALDLATRIETLPTAGRTGQRLFVATLSQMADMLLERGLSGDAERAFSHYTRGNEVFERELQANPDSPLAARDLSISLERLGDFLVKRAQPGDAALALGYCSRSLAIRERLLQAGFDSPDVPRGVSIGLLKLGDLLNARGQPGDAALALTNYSRSLELSERLLQAHSTSATAARDVMASMEKFAGALAKRGLAGDAALALSNYSRSLELGERLLQADPDSVQAARDVSVGLDRLGDFLVQRGQPGDAVEALSHYNRSLEMRERLLKANPNSAVAAKDVCFSLNTLGDLLAARGQTGDRERALTHYNRDLELRERLLAANPDSAQAARDVSMTLSDLGDVLIRRGQPGDVELALSYYSRENEVLGRLLQANPDSARAARDLFVCHLRLGDLLAKRGEPDDAALVLTNYNRSLEIAKRLLKAKPDSVQAARDLVAAYFALAQFASRTQDPESAEKNRRAGYEVLDAHISAGMQFEKSLMDFHRQLRQIYSP